MKLGYLVAAMLSIAILHTVSSRADTSAKQVVETRKLMHAYARCVVRSNHDRASEAIIADVNNGTILRRYPELISSDCMSQTAGNGSQMRFGGDLYRYALADALVNADFAKTGETDFSNRLPLAHLLPPNPAQLATEIAKTKSKSERAKLQKSFDTDVGVSWLSHYGECVVRLSPTKARYWLLTPADTPEEVSRINDLGPSFGSCLREGTLKFNRTTMRGTVAINYYRLATATVQMTTAKAQ